MRLCLTIFLCALFRYFLVCVGAASKSVCCCLYRSVASLGVFLTPIPFPSSKRSSLFFFLSFFSLSLLQRILAQGSCQIDHAIDDLEGAEAYDTAMIMVEFEGGRTAVIDVCRQAPYG